MTTPARRHYLAESARLAAQDEAPLAKSSAYQQLLKKLHDDRMILKAIKGIEDKATAKATMLPVYADWLHGVLKGDTPNPNDRITPTLLVWQIDCGLLDEALPLARFALQHGLQASDEYQRSLPEVIIEEYAAAIDRGEAVTGDTLKALVSWATDKGADGMHTHNINDNIRAKLLKAAGEWAEKQKMQSWALHLYETAVSYNSRIGVKKRIADLSR